MKKLIIFILVAVLLSSCVTVNINFAEKQPKKITELDTLESWY